MVVKELANCRGDCCSSDTSLPVRSCRWPWSPHEGLQGRSRRDPCATMWRWGSGKRLPRTRGSDAGLRRGRRRRTWVKARSGIAGLKKGGGERSDSAIFKLSFNKMPEYLVYFRSYCSAINCFGIAKFFFVPNFIEIGCQFYRNNWGSTRGESVN